MCSISATKLSQSEFFPTKTAWTILIELGWYAHSNKVIIHCLFTSFSDASTTRSCTVTTKTISPNSTTITRLGIWPNRTVPTSVSMMTDCFRAVLDYLHLICFACLKFPKIIFLKPWKVTTTIRKRSPVAFIAWFHRGTGSIAKLWLNVGL